jgi:hypothetical protein
MQEIALTRDLDSLGLTERMIRFQGSVQREIRGAKESEARRRPPRFVTLFKVDLAPQPARMQRAIGTTTFTYSGSVGRIIARYANEPRSLQRHHRVAQIDFSINKTDYAIAESRRIENGEHGRARKADYR